MNSSQTVFAAAPSPFAGVEDYLTLMAEVSLTAKVTAKGGVLVFDRVSGDGTLFLNGRVVAQKKPGSAAQLQVPLPTGVRGVTLVLVLHVQPENRTRLPGLVFVETPA